MPWLICLLFASLPALAQPSVSVLERRDLPQPSGPASASAELRLGIALLEDAGWQTEKVLASVREAAGILAQCGISLTAVELVRLAVPAPFLDFFTPLSRQLAAAVPLQRPSLWFVRDTRQRPAFDAEAIGRGNSRTRPELTDTVWLTLGIRDLGIAVAHELTHVLMDSGEHSEEAGNLMRADTAAENTRLSDAQCARMRETGSANGLLRLSR